MADVAVSLAWELYILSNWTVAIEYLRDEMRALADLVNTSGVMMLPREVGKTNLFVEMRELAYAVDDMVDDLLLKHGWMLRRRGFKELFVIIYLRTQIRGFNNKVRDIRLRVEDYERSINGRRYGLDIIRSTTPPPPPPPHVGLVGLDHHVSLICQQVLLATGRPSMVAIVGMTGIGKTTLAGLVSESLEVKQRFEVLAWLSLSTGTKEGGRFKMTTESSEHEEVLEDDHGLIAKVHDLLQGRHYLIVLEHVRWGDQLGRLMNKALLPAVEGSCVLITTRSMAVARSYADPSTALYELPLLNQEQSRELLQRYMGGGDGEVEECCMDVESVHTLLKICGGLPLALNKAGVMLHNSCKPPGRTHQEILKELEAPGNNIIMDELLELCLDVIATNDDSYLPSCFLKECYLYLAALCKDGRIIEASKLIRLWVAEGFIPYDDYPNQTMEDTTRDLLDLMLHLSMIQHIHHETTDLRRSSSRDFLLTIHPIFYHHLCVDRETRDNNRLIDAIAGNRTYTTFYHLPYKPRRLVLICKTNQNLHKLYLRSEDHVLMDTTTNATAHPRSCRLDDIGDTMISLRYLGLRRCSVLTKLPSSVATLHFLQTLNIRETGIQQLPKKLGAGLRHLLAPDSDIGGVDISNPYNLDTLAVDDCEGWLLGNLRGLRTYYNIRSLSLKGLGRLTETPWDELAESLVRLKKMENLYLHAKDPIKISTLSKELSHLKF